MFFFHQWFKLIILFSTCQHLRNLYGYTIKYHEAVQHFNFQLMHTTLKNVEFLKHFKISKTAPTCFGLQEKPSSESYSQYLAKNYTLG